MRPSTSAHVDAHKHSSIHRDEVLSSALCGCFHCLATFGPADILDWVDAPVGQRDANIDDCGQTALCPKCGIDSVIGDRSGYPLSTEFLRQMRDHWFSAAK